MFELLYGPAGSGKTAYILAQLNACVQNGQPAILVVPEQFSFDNERLLLERLGPKAAARVQVLSFSRLAELVLRQAGAAARQPVDEASALLFISEALYQTRDSLGALKGYLRPTDADAVLRAVRECKACAGDTAVLAQATVQLPEGALRDKLTDLVTVIDGYDALLKGSDLIAPEDRLTQCAEQLPRCGFADGAHVFVDSFKGFTGCEERVLQALAQAADKLTVSLCTDTVAPCRAGERFFTVWQTAERLRRIAAKCGLPLTETPLPAAENGKAALRHIERGILHGQRPPLPADPETLTMRLCADRRDEAAQAVRFIRRYLREHGGHLRDITVVVRDLNAWQGLLDTALRRAGLPFYMDARREVQNEVLFATLLSALSCCAAADTEHLLRIAKLGLVCPIDDAQRLEHHCFIWSLRASDWARPFTEHPDGLNRPRTEQSDERLQCIEQTRLAVMQPLLQLRADLRGEVDGRTFAAAVSRYINACSIPQRMQQLHQQLEQDGAHQAAQWLSDTWQLCMQLLERMAQVFVSPRPAARLIDAFVLLVSQADLGTLPQSADSVRIGQADRIRYNDPALLLLLGINDGEFPAAPASGGVLTDADRVQLSRLDLPFATDLLEQLSEEYFYAYAAVSAPKQHLYVSRSDRTADGEQAVPSAVWQGLCELFDGQPVLTEPLPPETEADVFEKLTAGGSDGQQRATYQAFLQQGPLAGAVQAWQRAEQRSADFCNADAAARIFAQNVPLSASRITQYHQCPFSYFCKYELQLQPPRPAEIDALSIGDITHKVLQTLLERYLKQGFDVTDECIAQDVDALIDEQLAALPTAVLQRARMEFLLQQCRQNCVLALRRMLCELRQSRFVPAAFELPIGKPYRAEDTAGEKVPAWVIPFAEGRSLLLGGTVDRVDLYTADNGVQYLRIIDYKATSRTLSLADICYGLNLQMLLYLFALQHSGTRFAAAQPAGALYLPTTPDALDKPQPDDQLRDTAIINNMKGKGMLLNNADVLLAMDREPGTYISAKLKKDGTLSERSGLIVTPEQIDVLENHVVSLLQQMGQAITQGRIPARPHDASRCKKCDYRSICTAPAAEEEPQQQEDGDLWKRIGYHGQEVQ